MKANKAFFILLEKWLEGQFGEKWDTTVVLYLQKMSRFKKILRKFNLTQSNLTQSI